MNYCWWRYVVYGNNNHFATSSNLFLAWIMITNTLVTSISIRIIYSRVFCYHFCSVFFSFQRSFFAPQCCRSFFFRWSLIEFNGRDTFENGDLINSFHSHPFYSMKIFSCDCHLRNKLFSMHENKTNKQNTSGKKRAFCSRIHIAQVYACVNCYCCCFHSIAFKSNMQKKLWPFLNSRTIFFGMKKCPLFCA